MSYLWDVGIKLKNSNRKMSDIVFKQAEVFSPYMECSFEDINFDLDDNNEIEINGLYRFIDIFSYLIDVNYEEYTESRKVLFDLIMHYLLRVDLKQGYCVREFCKKFFYEDIKNGIWGKDIAYNMEAFTTEEKNIILDSIYNLYSGGSGLYFFNVILGNIFKNSLAYINKETEHGLFIYVGEAYTDNNKRKIDLITSLFLPVRFNVYICWDKHFPVLGVDKTMYIEQNVLF